MSLVLLSGYPLSGKTALAHRLKEELPKYNCPHEVHLVLDADSNSIMKDSVAERMSRAALKSTVQRLIQPNRVVAVDSTNYLQSFRYELCCLAKEYNVGFLIVRCVASVDSVIERNKHSTTSNGPIFDEAALRDAIQRYEEPKERSKWDIHFPYCVDNANSLADLCKAIVSGKPLKSNRCTQSTPSMEASLFSELDRTTKLVMEALLNAAQTGMQPGDRVPIRNSPYSLPLPQSVTSQSLVSVRRQFINYVKLNPVEDPSTLTELFIEFVSSSLK
uniref:Protein KTI12 homolog n=1 Tax=Trichuris muris TaxID=70415 RepID=A0A5S6Q9V3_TRIMR